MTFLEDNSSFVTVVKPMVFLVTDTLGLASVSVGRKKRHSRYEVRSDVILLTAHERNLRSFCFSSLHAKRGAIEAPQRSLRTSFFRMNPQENRLARLLLRTNQTEIAGATVATCISLGDLKKSCKANLVFANGKVAAAFLLPLRFHKAYMKMV